MKQRDELRSIQIHELRNRMDGAQGESARGEGADGEEFVQGMLDVLDAASRRKAGAALLDHATRTVLEGE